MPPKRVEGLQKHLQCWPRAAIFLFCFMPEKCPESRRGFTVRALGSTPDVGCPHPLLSSARSHRLAARHADTPKCRSPSSKQLSRNSLITAHNSLPQVRSRLLLKTDSAAQPIFRTLPGTLIVGQDCCLSINPGPFLPHRAVRPGRSESARAESPKIAENNKTQGLIPARAARYHAGRRKLSMHNAECFPAFLTSLPPQPSVPTHTQLSAIRIPREQKNASPQNSVATLYVRPCRWKKPYELSSHAMDTGMGSATSGPVRRIAMLTTFIVSCRNLLLDVALWR